MTALHYELIKDRISTATSFSKIAVFSLPKDHNYYNDRYSIFESMFAATVITRGLVDKNSNLIGVYDKTEIDKFDTDILNLQLNKGLE